MGGSQDGLIRLAAQINAVSTVMASVGIETALAGVVASSSSFGGAMVLVGSRGTKSAAATGAGRASSSAATGSASRGSLANAGPGSGRS
jgi:hypothetical protein